MLLGIDGHGCWLHSEWELLLSLDWRWGREMRLLLDAEAGAAAITGLAAEAAADVTGLDTEAGAAIVT